MADGDWATAAEVGNKVPYITISGTSTPSTTAVEAEIADREAQLRSAMAAGGWNMTQSETNADAYLRSLVVTGVAGWILGVRSKRLGTGQADTTGQKYEATWEAAVESIRLGANVIPGGVKTSGGPPVARGGVTSTYIDGTITELTDSNLTSETFFQRDQEF